MGPIGCPETSIINYQYSLRNNTEERWSHLLRGGSLKSPVSMTLQVYRGPKRVHLFLSTPPEERSGTAVLTTGVVLSEGHYAVKLCYLKPVN